MSKITGNNATQFRLSTLFVVTLGATILAAFLNPRGQEHMLAGTVAVVLSMGFGWLIGLKFPPQAERVFWGMVIAAMMQAVCAEVILFDQLGVIAWPIAAGFAAVFVASRNRFYRRMGVGAFTAGGVIALYMTLTPANLEIAAAMILCAAIGGALMTVLIEIVRWTESKHRIPQPAIGLTLVLSAIVFSVTADTWIPGW